jgi:hypothetical protein
MDLKHILHSRIDFFLKKKSGKINNPLNTMKLLFIKIKKKIRKKMQVTRIKPAPIQKWYITYPLGQLHSFDAPPNIYII